MLDSDTPRLLQVRTASELPYTRLAASAAGDRTSLATSLTLPTLPRVEQNKPTVAERTFGYALVTCLTAFALAIHGYHPYAEDGGIYLAGVKRLLNPGLYPYWSEFVTEHLHFSLFAPMVAGLVLNSHLSLMTVWLLLYAASFWLTLFAAWQLVIRCYTSRQARCGAVALLATWLTLPVAGTSLMLMDPYLSARSISTPCILLALVGVLDLFHPQEDGLKRGQAAALCAGSFALAALVHPLMAAYGLGCIVLLACFLSGSAKVRFSCTIGLSLFAILLAAIIYKFAPPEPAAYLNVALTRTYWFVATWQTYEQFGLAAPIAILAVIGFRRRGQASAAASGLARAGAVAGTIGCIVAVLFARTDAPTYAIARLQPLRVFQIVYILMILAVGAFLGERLLQRRASRWLTMFTMLAAVMVYAERQTFPCSSHFESPGSKPENAWVRAFEWIRVSTPADALFALDAHYVSYAGEDVQTFRAIAERSALADYSKDGGVASIAPALTAAWVTGQTAQTGLNTAPDAARVAALRPLGVSWIVLPGGAVTGFMCPYTEEAAKVCRLPER